MRRFLMSVAAVALGLAISNVADAKGGGPGGTNRSTNSGSFKSAGGNFKSAGTSNSVLSKAKTSANSSHTLGKAKSDPNSLHTLGKAKVDPNSSHTLGKRKTNTGSVAKTGKPKGDSPKHDSPKCDRPKYDCHKGTGYCKPVEHFHCQGSRPYRYCQSYCDWWRPCYSSCCGCPFYYDCNCECYYYCYENRYICVEEVIVVDGCYKFWYEPKQCYVVADFCP